MLRPSIRIGIDRSNLDSTLGGGFTNSSEAIHQSAVGFQKFGIDSQSDLTTIRYQN